MANERAYSNLLRVAAQYVGVSSRRWKRFLTNYQYHATKKEQFNPDTFEQQAAEDLNEYRRLIR